MSHAGEHTGTHTANRNPKMITELSTAPAPAGAATAPVFTAGPAVTPEGGPTTWSRRCIGRHRTGEKPVASAELYATGCLIDDGRTELGVIDSCR